MRQRPKQSSPTISGKRWGEEPLLDFSADNGESFTAGELLFKLHHAIAGRFDLGDHVFFEGLMLERSPEEGGTPVYEMYLGS